MLDWIIQMNRVSLSAGRMIARLIVPAVFSTGVCNSCVAEQPTREAVMPNKHRAVFQKYCLDCHDSATQEGMMDLEALSLEVSSDIPTAERWAKVLNAINSGEMPPKDNDPIADEEKIDFLRDLSEQMVIARKILSDSGGVITLRRLNRREYANTIEALLGVRPDVSNLPDDQASSGFDTQGASLFMSSDQIEQYLATAKLSLELALLPQKHLQSKTIRIEPEEEYTPHYAAAAEEMRDKKRRGEAYFSQKAKAASEFGFLDDYSAKKQRRVEWLPLMEDYLNRPETKTGATLIMTIKQGGYTKIKLPTLHEMQDGHYTIRVRAAAYPDARERLHYLEFSESDTAGRTRLGWRKVTAELSDPQIIEFSFLHRRGQKKQILIHQRSHQDRADKNQATIDMKANGTGTIPGLWIDWAELTGPEPVSHSGGSAQRIFFDKPADWSDRQYAEEVLQRFAVRAFRGEQPDELYARKLLEHYAANRAQGKNLTQALLDPLAIILSSPRFLYMMESADAQTSSSLTEFQLMGSPLTGPQLAVRLSYFLWSAPPDDELMSLALSGDLQKDSVLQKQTARLLADSKADQFVQGFVHQWLQMDRLGMFQFDGVQFPTFDNAARESARDEVFETFHFMLQEKLPLPTLLKADFVVINDLLAGYYGIPGIEGHEFRKVSVAMDSSRGGLLGMAAVLAMGSDGQRSSPVERGAWVLRKLLNDPPPPAPPNIPMLSRLDGQILSARDLASAHQEQPQCANCHQKIDPIGYGLENFNAVGLWRDKEAIDKRGKFGKRQIVKEFSIDPSGQLPDGKSFANYFALRSVVADRGDDFIRGFTESLITYGLGRPFGFTDQDLADEIISHAGKQKYETSALIHAFTQSAAFRSK